VNPLNVANSTGRCEARTAFRKPHRLGRWTAFRNATMLAKDDRVYSFRTSLSLLRVFRLALVSTTFVRVAATGLVRSQSCHLDCRFAQFRPGHFRTRRGRLPPYVSGGHSLVHHCCYAQSFSVRRVLRFPQPTTNPYTLTPSRPASATFRAYQLCLLAWRKQNLGLLLPPPIFVAYGDLLTGVGFELVRVPPLGLRERITNFTRFDTDSPVSQSSVSHEWPQECNVTSTLKLEMSYRVMNPGWLTWPVADHQGTIAFMPRNSASKEKFGTASPVEAVNAQISSMQAGVEICWTVSWTPLLLPLVSLQQPFEKALEAITKLIIHRAMDHLVWVAQPEQTVTKPGLI
jgi:hypothetical protein